MAALLPVVSDLSGESRTFVSLTSHQRNQALGRSARRWSDLHAAPRAHSLASDHPEVAAEFLEVCNRPGLTAADIAPAGNDRVRWRCSTCAHQWETRTANRTRLGTGCPPCRYRAAGRKNARPREGRSFADVHPQLVRHFVRDVTSPGRTLEELRPNSTDTCLWSCPHCGRPWLAQPHRLNRRPSAGCSQCRFVRASATKRARMSPDEGAAGG
jgi:hypothetical protein